jgi:hypothetical protein
VSRVTDQEAAGSECTFVFVVAEEKPAERRDTWYKQEKPCHSK